MVCVGERGGRRRTGVDVAFMGAFACVAGFESCEVARAPVGHFTLLCLVGMVEFRTEMAHDEVGFGM